MLRIPSFRKIDDLTVYQDDALWTRFYLVPSMPTIRRDKNGRPIFLLTIFHTSDEAREASPTLPRGGGFMNFDVQFAVDEAAGQSAKEGLQRWVNEEYVRRKADPQYSALPEYAGSDPPSVEITDPLLSGGTVTMHTTQSSLLVTGRFAEAPASLVSGSTAVFNMDLTETGAGFMHELFVDSAGTGRVDLTPVQVIYNLRMWARLPPISVRVTGDSERIHQTLNKISQTTRDNVCTPLEVENFREHGTSSSTLKETGIVDVKVDKGDATVPNDVLQTLQQYALELFDTMIKERFLVPAETDMQPLEFDGTLPDRNWSKRSPTGRYKVRETVNHSTMHLEIKLDRSQVVEWPTGGEATLQTFFAGASREELRRHVVELTADDFNSLGVTVRALIDFEKQPVQAIEVQTEYTARDEDGENHTTTRSFTFRAGETAPGKFDPTVINGKREYRFRYAVIFDDGTRSDFTPWETRTNRDLNVAVANPGKLELEVSGASLNWDIVRAIKADLTYSDPLDGATSLQQSYELTKLNPVRKWERQFNRPIKGSVAVKSTYFLTDDKVVEGEIQTVSPTNTLFLVPPPQVDVLNISLLPAGIWNDVAQVAVSLEYEAGQGRVYDETFHLKKIDEFVEWTVLLRDPTRRTFKYQTKAIYKTGGHDDSGWITKTGDQALLIEVKGVPRLRVNILSNLVDFTRTPAVKVALVYGDERHTVAFTSGGAAVWDVPLAPDGRREYSYTITWHSAEGQTVSSGPHRTADTELFIPRAQLPAVGKLDVLLRGFAVDFTITPFVDIALVWRDGSLEERKTVTLSKEQPNTTWSVPIGDRTQRTYHYAITYNLADGTRVPGRQADTDDPVVSVTRYQP
jgi:hypothetical protein